MSPRKRRVAIRMLIFLAVFSYIGYIANQRLPSFDFWVVMGFFALFFTWSIIETIIYREPQTLVVEDDDQRSYLYLQLSSMLVLFVALLDFLEFKYTRVTLLEPEITILGFIFFIIYIAVRYQAIIHLGSYYNPRVALYEEHSLVKEGPYRKIRHPFYLSALLSVLSLSCIFNSGAALLLTALAVIPSIVYRINIEEEFLLEHFGEEYKQYMEQSSRIIPGIW